ncbi:Glucan endo-1,3-beta-D-glucosidase [Heracleum sosnowskyi]|uniref:Glucan endo-1,3-beta-D-glucosidase n=1 Tax=Heracleum sosnowskyi TaxID=360622 RepID=A0AAD8J0G7_9APIA|nr:Glucan endo-1,3-beta-D-glucosidase [Heracleum sosnowskyi]
MTMNSQALITLSLSLLVILQSSLFASSQSFIGVNYGQLADNLPAPAVTAKLLESTAIGKVRLYNADPAIVKALANTGIGIVIGLANGEIPGIASDPNVAGQWVGANVLQFYPASNIDVITVGNEVMTSGDQGLMSQLLPAMQNIQNALNSASLGGKVKVSTVHSMAVLANSDPPSSGSFNSGFGDTMKALLQFQKATGSPFMINPYPFFAYQSDPRPETLAFCLFQPNAGRVDSASGIKYMNMFDAQVDAVKSALNSMGFKEIEIVVAETGWPYKGDPNEDLSMVYDVGLLKNSQTPTAPTTPKTPTTPANPSPKAAACPIQPGGPCYEPATVQAHAAYAMNLYYQNSGKNPWDCDFVQTAALASTNPSYAGCNYPGGN